MPCAVDTVAMKPDISWSWQSRSAPAITPVPWTRVSPISAGSSCAVEVDTLCTLIRHGAGLHVPVGCTASLGLINWLSRNVGSDDALVILKPKRAVCAGTVNVAKPLASDV